jgi:glycosyltransferase involved in cell wall biosynthesis
VRRGGASIDKVLHIITDLGQGGAEAVLYRLIGVTRDVFRHAVVSLHEEGVYGQHLRELGVPVTALGMRRGRLSIEGLRRLQRIIAEYRPHVMQTRLDHANLVGGLMARFAGAPPVVWAVHSTDLGPLRTSWKTRIVRRFCAQLSHTVPRLIVSDARSSAALHAKIGFSAAKLLVVPNGVDPMSFRPDREARERMRGLWGVARDEILLGCVARWDPLKDHENLVRAVRQLSDRGHRFRCALIGRGMNAQNEELLRLIHRWGVGERLILAGASSEVAAVMNALDIHVLPSRSESLPVAVLEAMACGTPCVVTDVGDARHIVGETGWIARPQDSAALAEAIEAALVECHPGAQEPRSALCRARIIREFSLARMGAEYAALWSRAAGNQRGA